MPTKPSKDLEVFFNPYPDREYEIRMECPEFTCLCPRTGQPDFATLRICYVPKRLCLELKSLKLYLWNYRQEGAFHEDVTNRILDDLVRVARPHRMEIEADFFVRGGIHTVIRVVYPPTQKTPTVKPRWMSVRGGSASMSGGNELDGPAEAFGEGGFVSCSGGFRPRRKRDHGCKAVGIHPGRNVRDRKRKT